MHRPAPPSRTPAAPFDGDLTLRVLGEPSLQRIAADGSRQRVLGMGKPLALLTYLAVAPQHEASREFLADLLWGDDSVSDPLHSLRNALLLISKQVDATLIESSLSRCRLTRALPSDLSALSQALGAHDLERAMTIYTGEFLPHFAAPGCRQFEHWSESVRLRVRTDVANAADVLVRQLLDAGRARDAEVHARRMIEIDPLNQRGRRVLLETLIAAGDRMAALTEAAVTEQWLETEEIEPETATTALLQHARRARLVPRGSCGQDQPDAPEPLEASTDLVGRAAEFAAITGAWESARAGCTSLVSVVAGAGIGKTRLLRDVENRLRAQRAQVVALRALTDERDVPFSFVAALAAELARLPGAAAVSQSTGGILVGLDPSLASVFRSAADFSASDQVLRRARALHELLTCVADERATALLLDDLHWADEASLAVLPAMLARMTATRVLAVAASRPGRGVVLASDRTHHLTLSPLCAEQIGQLIASIRPLPQQSWSEALVRGVFAASRGVPVFALLALRDATQRGLVRVGESAWECDDQTALDAGLRDRAVLSIALRDLPPRARRILLQLAVVGRGLPADMLTDAAESAPSPAIPEALEALERRALIARVGDTVAPAHDVVAEWALESASHPERQAAARSVALEMLARNDRRWQERGMRLLATVATARELALRLAPLLRGISLPRGVGIAGALGPWLGESTNHERMARDVARQLPMGLRLRPFRRHLAGAGLAASAFLALPAWIATHPAAAVDASLLGIIVTGDRVARSFAVTATMSGWNASTALDGRPVSSAMSSLEARRGMSAVRLSQRTGARLVERIYDDSGGSEIDVTDAAGESTRLTWSPGDDLPGSWSPDGRFVAFGSSRWSPLRHHRIGIVDRETGALRRLGNSSGSEARGLWSPDGSRLAFSRNFLDGRPAELCVVDVDGSGERCTTGVAVQSPIVGWRTPHELLVAYGNDVMAVYPDSAWSVTPYARNAYGATLSPNGRWFAWFSGSAEPRATFVAPSADLRRARQVRWSAADADVNFLAWGPYGAPAPYVERITIRSPTDTVLVGVPHRFEVTARWSDSSDAPPLHVRWRVGAVDDGVIDSAGTLVARRPGIIVVVATTGGWRVTSRRVVAVPATRKTIATEDWTSGLTAWRLFGDPQPVLTHDPRLGNALLNNGDGSYFSGAYFRTRLGWTRGLAVDAVISTIVTELQWQTLDVDLGASIDERALNAWDHQTGFIPRTVDSANPSCAFFYPGREGIHGPATIIPLAPPPDGAPPTRLPIGDGRPFRVRLQVFPDGRCGMAINGAPLFISSDHFDRNAPLRLTTYGNSWRTRMLLGPLTITDGVPGDIDWTRISRLIPTTMPAGPPRRTTPRSPR